MYNIATIATWLAGPMVWSLWANERMVRFDRRLALMPGALQPHSAIMGLLRSMPVGSKRAGFICSFI
jgi:hypothetical protein